MNKLNGGTFNLLYGRDNETVKSEVARLLAKHNLDFLVVEEAEGYWTILHQIEGYNYYSTRAYAGGSEVGILVKDSLRVDKVSYQSFGDGWITIRGGHKAGPTFPRIRIDGWLKVAGVHLPTPSIWDAAGRLEAPRERLDDYMGIAKRIYRYFTFPGKKIVAGDFNESSSTEGEWSPAWIAKRTGAKVYTPFSRAGHGRIDYVLAKNVRVSGIKKDLDIKEESDHEPVVFTVWK